MSDQSSSEQENKTQTMGLMSHLIELRDRLLRMVISILVFFLMLFYWANDIYTYLAEPLTRHLPAGSQMIAIDVASPFLTPFKLVLMLSVFISMPVILYQLWAFVAPGLYRKEKRLAAPLLISSILLFYAGVLFAYYIVFPLVFGFFSSVGPEMVSISTDIGRYLDFVLSLFFGFGLAFEIPIATIIMVAVGLTTPDKLAEKRPFVIVGAFILGMVLTPPDIISQVLLAIPMWILFESGLFASRIIFKDRLKDEKEYDDEIAAEAEADTANESKDQSNDNYPDAETIGSAVLSDYEVTEESNHKEDQNDGDDHDEYEPLTEEEMDAELDAIDKEENDTENAVDEDRLSKQEQDSSEKIIKKKTVKKKVTKKNVAKKKVVKKKSGKKE